jgi:site-specific recombinase XerD
VSDSVCSARPGGAAESARKPKHLPVVMTREEVKAVLANSTGDKCLMASLMHGAGFRLTQCLRLRVQENRWMNPQTLDGFCGHGGGFYADLDNTP